MYLYNMYNTMNSGLHVNIVIVWIEGGGGT